MQSKEQVLSTASVVQQPKERRKHAGEMSLVNPRERPQPRVGTTVAGTVQGIEGAKQAPVCVPGHMSYCLTQVPGKGAKSLGVRGNTELRAGDTSRSKLRSPYLEVENSGKEDGTPGPRRGDMGAGARLRHS